MLIQTHGLILCWCQTIAPLNLPHPQYGRDREDKVVRWGGHRQTSSSQVQRYSCKKVGKPERHPPSWANSNQFWLNSTVSNQWRLITTYHNRYLMCVAAASVAEATTYPLDLCKTRWAWAWYHVVSHYIICDHFWRGESWLEINFLLLIYIDG